MQVLSFKLSQPERLLSGQRETFVKRDTVYRTNKAELAPKNSEKVESCRGNEIQLKGPQRVKLT